MKIFINPGHMVGVDPGAVGNGLIEAEVALNIGRLVEKYLQAVGFTTKLLQLDPPRVVANDANNWGADLFISIHCNAAATAAANGTETFYWNGSADGKRLAGKIHNQLVNSLKLANRNIKAANFTVLGATVMPAVLVETAFITNPFDAKILANAQDEIARAIARGVTDYTSTYAPLPVSVTPAKGGRLSEHFDASEFTCHHCGAGANKISGRLIELLEKLRTACGDKPLHINSGYRCPAHNAAIGGAQDSQHMHGTAADVATPAGMTFEAFKRAVESLPFDGVGYYPPLEEGGDSFIHCDTRNGGVGAGITWEG